MSDYQPDNIPDDAIILQCGTVVGEDGVLGHVETNDVEVSEE
ncbi:hypothetical protein [Halorientalis salina]|nr:hypothetical protein [Halorientalis salina]